MSNRTKLIGIIVIIILIFVLVKRTGFGGWLGRLFHKRDIDYDCVPTQGGRISSDREEFLKGVANSIYTDIYNTSVFGHDCSLYTSTNGMCDEELVFVAQHYRKTLTRGNSIYADLSGWGGEYTLFCDFDSLKAHLSKIGET